VRPLGSRGGQPCDGTAIDTRYRATTVALWLLVASQLLACADSSPEGAPAVMTLSAGHFVLDAGASPPAPDAAWEPVTLPDLWGESRPGTAGLGWYRLAFRPPTDAPPVDQWGVLLPKLESNAAVFVNDQWLGQGGGFGDTVSINWNRPLYFPLSGNVLGASTNFVYVRLQTHGRPSSGLARVEVGPHEMLHPRWKRLHGFRIGVAQASTGLAVVISALFGALWASGVGGAVYGYFSVAALAWGVNSLNYHIQEIPLGFWTWKWIAHASLDVFAICFVMLVLRLLDLRMPRIERALLLIGALAVVVPRLVTPAGFVWATAAFHSLSLTLGFGCLALLVRYRTRLPGREVRIYATLGTLVVALAAWDYLIQFGVFPLGTSRVFQLSGILTFLGFGSALLMRFIDAYRRAENTNALLETRVTQAQAELATNFERLRDLERQQAVSHERERIMREMHDGVGSELVSTLSMVEEGDAQPGEVADALRDSLDEMRLVIHSIDPVVGDLQTLLGSMRSRIERRLRRHALRFRWQVTDLPDTPDLRPEHYLHILRILQEAITNALRHAAAHVITLTTDARADQAGRPGILIRVADDGHAAPGTVEPGYGTRNMHDRAARLDGQVTVSAGDAGTTVELWFPLTSPARARDGPA